jgi:prepilin-type N-terminal cleavage/methylation domain-containing protein
MVGWDLVESAVNRAGKGREKGFSLVEIPVALVVLGIVIVIAARTFSTAGNMHTDSRFANQAMAFASAKLAEFETMPLSMLDDGEDQVNSRDGFVFTRKWTVSQPIAGSEARSVQVEVRWQSQKTKDFVQVATLLR